MPVDFARVPPRVRVPPPPHPAIILWTLLLVVMIGAGAGLTFWQWTAGKPTNTLGFWCCAVVYPVFAWVLVLCFARGIAYARRGDAMAINHVSARIERERHAQASEPLAVLGHAWCFSGDAQENTAEGIANGRLKLDTRPSAAEPGTDVRAQDDGSWFYIMRDTVVEEAEDFSRKVLAAAARANSGLPKRPGRAPANSESESASESEWARPGAGSL